VTLKDFIQRLISILGDFTIFAYETLLATRYFWRRRGLFLRQCEFIGVSSLGISLAAGLFMGAVLGFQLYVSLHQFGAEALLGGTVGVSLFRELAPVMASIMVTGRAGAAMAAEISSMRISEQIDALEVMAVNPIEYLVFPRVSAGVLMMPLLAIFFAAIASLAACAIACGVMDLQISTYWHQYVKVVDPIEVVHCVVKSAAFGLLITWLGCFFGFRAYGGAKAVGRATRNTVVVTCLAILLCDYLLTSFLPFGFRTLKVM
jgi:phospholipid/cholesterol/gamma-HCH transport system permease protein